MENNNSINAHLLRLGGCAGILAGICVLSFALISQSQGLLFTPEVFEGGSIDTWMKAMNDHPKLARGLPVLPVIGFSSMLIVGIILYQMMVEKSWQKNLALSGYLIGVPVSVAAFVSHLSFINELLTLSSVNETTADQLQLLAAFHMHEYMTINYAIGPFFIILIGNSLIAWAALKSNLLPRWLCYWAFFNGSLILLGIMSVVIPALRFAQIGGPITMLWFISLGFILLKKSKNGRFDLAT